METKRYRSYVICLVHLVPASILNRHGQIIFGAWFEYLKVPLIFFLILIVVWIGKILFQQMHNAKLYNYLGYYVFSFQMANIVIYLQLFAKSFFFLGLIH